MRDTELRRSAIAMAFPLKRVWTVITGNQRQRRSLTRRSTDQFGID